MSEPAPLRLGVWCAALREGSVLLSKRSDLNVWALPGGRLDNGESLTDAAEREVFEETGVHTASLRPVGLYYMAGWRRLNVLFAGEVSGGSLLRHTNETRDNRFFPLDALPKMPLFAQVQDVAAGQVGMMRMIDTSAFRRWQLRARFGLRYVENALRGRPEPVFPSFSVTASALVHSPVGSRLLTVPGEMTAAGQLRALPRLVLSGEPAPWDALATWLQSRFGVRASMRWAGLWQHAAADALELVFAGSAEATSSVEWTSLRTAALAGRDSTLLTRMNGASPWLIEAHVHVGPSRTDVLSAGVLEPLGSE